MTRRSRNRRRSVGRMVGGGLLELLAVLLLIALVTSGRLHRGATESAEVVEESPIVEVGNPWEIIPGSDLPGDSSSSSPGSGSTIWSLIPDWRDWEWPNSERTTPRGPDISESDKEEVWDEQFVERQLMSAADALQRWLHRQADKALESLDRAIESSR
jgi:hypothetical protein